MKVTTKELAQIKEHGDVKKSDLVQDIAADDKLVTGRIKHATKAITNASERFFEASDIILSANERLRDSALTTEKQSKKMCSSVKSVVNEIKDQLIKVDSILGDNVEVKIKQLERIASALEAIKNISKDDKTMRAITALTQR